MITIDGHKLEEFNMVALADHDNPILPEVRNEVIRIPDRHGAYHMDSTFEPLFINIPIGIRPQQDYADTVYHAERFADLFVDQFGKTKEVELIFDYTPDRFYKVRYNGSLPIQRLASMARFDLPLTAYDPFSYSVEYADEVTWGSESITFASTMYKYGHESLGSSVKVTSPTTENITVIGYAVKPIIEISGSADSLSLEVSGQTITFPSFSNSDWVIDCEKYSVFKNGQDHYEDVRLRDFWLFKGNNELKINGSNIDIDLRVKFRDKLK